MSTIKKSTLLGSILLLSSCAHENQWIKREISSENVKNTEKYIVSNESVQKRIKELKSDQLKEGQCFSDPETKMYLTNIKATSTGSFKDLRSQINVDKLENNDQVEYYFCRITCHLGNKYANYWTTLTDSPNKHSDDNAFICQGVTMEMVNIPGTTLSTLGPIVHNLMMLDFKEIFPKVKESNYKMSPLAKSDYDKRMNENFLKISQAYITSTMPAMIEAGKILEQIALQKPGYKNLTDKYAQMLKDNNWQLKNDFSKDYFVMINLIQFGGHLVYEKY